MNTNRRGHRSQRPDHDRLHRQRHRHVNDRGINVDAAGNLIIKNSACGNTSNYEIAASNRYGPIIDITAAGSAAVGGNISAVSTLTSTDPWANFSY